MALLQTTAQIKRLSSELANQIAAGEVIERPASVVKELIENALDAEATRIDIELDKAGVERIQITDDGVGIVAEELPLAVSRHATSKISEALDLQNLHSLGFRGEALASICSVSQWHLVSRTRTAPQATSLDYNAPGLLKTVNHAPGTSMTIQHLFYNTPARKKFLKAERTEYRHCEDAIKRLALAHYSTGFYVQHNQRPTLRLPAIAEPTAYDRRVARVCGEAFVQHAMPLDVSHANLRLWGWIGQPGFSRQSTDLQYFYINGRVIRDRLINHAIRIACQAFLPPGRQAAYVLYLEMPAADVDVNVHPTKHEVRFRESRWLHDFIHRCLRDHFQSASGQPGWNRTTGMLSPLNGLDHHRAEQVAEIPSYYRAVSDTVTASDRRSLNPGILFSRYLFSRQAGRVLLVDLSAACGCWMAQQWFTALQQENLQVLPLLIPELIQLDETGQAMFKDRCALLVELGFDFEVQAQGVLLKKMPAYLRGYEPATLLMAFLNPGMPLRCSRESLQKILTTQLPDVTMISLDSLLHDLQSEPEHYALLWREITPQDLAGLLTAVTESRQPE